MTYGFDNKKAIGNGPRIFVFELSRLVEERLTIKVRGQSEAQALAFLRDHYSDLEGKWETFDKDDFQVESTAAA
jgi:hypothetical protein